MTKSKPPVVTGGLLLGARWSARRSAHVGNKGRPCTPSTSGSVASLCITVKLIEGQRSTGLVCQPTARQQTPGSTHS